MDEFELLILKYAIELIHKDFDNYMSKWMEVQGLSVTFKDIPDPKNDYSQIIYN